MGNCVSTTEMAVEVTPTTVIAESNNSAQGNQSSLPPMRRVTFVAVQSDEEPRGTTGGAHRRRSCVGTYWTAGGGPDLEAIAEALARGASFGPYVLSVPGSTVSSVAGPRGPPRDDNERERYLSIVSTMTLEDPAPPMDG